MSGQPPVDLGDPESVRERNAEVKRQALTDQSVVSQLLASEPLRQFWWELLGSWQVFSSPFVPEASAMYYAAGARNVGLQFLAMFQTQPQLYQLMVAEAAGRQEKK